MRRVKGFTLAGASAVALAMGMASAPRANADTTIGDSLFGLNDNATISTNSDVTALNIVVPGAASPIQIGAAQGGLQQFYYSANGGPITPFNSLTWNVSTTFPPGFPLQSPSATYTSVGAPFNISTTYSIQGGSLNSNMTLTSAGSAVSLSIFQLGALDLNGQNRVTPGNPIQESVSGNQVLATDGSTTIMTDTSTASLPNGAGEGVTVNQPSAIQVGIDTSFFANIDNPANSSNETDLNNADNYYSSDNNDGQFGIEWSGINLPSDPNISAELNFSQQFNEYSFIPEPGTTLLTLVSLAACAGAVIRRRAQKLN